MSDTTDTGISPDMSTADIAKPSMPEQVRIACAIATGEAREPAANAISVRAARRDLNAKGNGTEWYRMVWRNGQWSYFANGRMPTGKFLASDRRCTLHGDVYAGEILCEHPRGGQVTDLYLVTDEHTDADGDTGIVLISLQWSKQRNGIRVILPTGASITVPNPRAK